MLIFDVENIEDNVFVEYSLQIKILGKRYEDLICTEGQTINLTAP